MWSSTFINKPLEQYQQNNYYKTWLINQFNVDCDIKNIIKQLQWFIREFRIPNLNDYNNGYINEYGICFEKHSIAINFKHNHQDKEVLLTLNNGKIIGVDLFYENDLTHYYSIEFDKSNIKTINMVKQNYQFFTKNRVSYVSYVSYVTSINPLFRAV